MGQETQTLGQETLTLGQETPTVDGLTKRLAYILSCDISTQQKGEGGTNPEHSNKDMITLTLSMATRKCDTYPELSNKEMMTRTPSLAMRR